MASKHQKHESSQKPCAKFKFEDEGMSVKDLLSAQPLLQDSKAAPGHASNRYFLFLTPAALSYPMSILYENCVQVLKNLPIEQGWIINELRTVMGFSFYLAPGVVLPIDQLSAEWGFNSEFGGKAIEVFSCDIPQSAHSTRILKRLSIDEDEDDLAYTPFELLMAGEDPFETYGMDRDDALDGMDGLQWLYIAGL